MVLLRRSMHLPQIRVTLRPEEARSRPLSPGPDFPGTGSGSCQDWKKVIIPYLGKRSHEKWTEKLQYYMLIYKYFYFL
jgi:hypothetical protein